MTFDAGRIRHDDGLMHYARQSNGTAVPSNWIRSTDGTTAATWRPESSGSVSYGSNSNDVTFADAAGASALVSRVDHAHRGVTSLSHSSNTYTGPVTLETEGSLYIVRSAANTYRLGAVDTTSSGTSSSGGGDGDATVRFYNYDDGETSKVGTWALVATTTAPLYGSQIWGNSSSAQNDSMLWTRFLQAGTYTVQIRGVRNSDKPIVTVKIDGSSVGTVDYYLAGLGYLRSTITGAVIASSGSHTIEVVMATKNASSSGYGMAFSDILLYRTA